MDRPKGQILVADDEPNLRRVLRAQLQRDGWEVHLAEDGEEAWRTLADHHIDVVISDLRMPGLDGMALLERMVAEHPDVPLIMITAHGTVDTAVEALKLGAFDYVTKPFDRDELKHVIDKAARTRALRQGEVTVPPSDRGRYRIIGDSPKMHEVYTVIERVADTPSTVLITGESGTGKELIAEALHEGSRRKGEPFIRVNCAAIPTELIESELFGYEKGAFTGAVTSKPGRFELADKGTLFLDEIAEIPPSMQVKLLRVLQEQSFERVGGLKTKHVDVRVVAATNRDLAQAIEAGDFREDLYYRLNVVHLHLPPLRERKRDIPLLVAHFVGKLNGRLERRIEGFSPAAQERLQAHQWRGNIRELENVVERSVLFCDGAVVGVEHLPAELREPDEGARISGAAMLEESGADPSAGLKDVVKVATAKLERELIQRALDQTEGNVTHAARLLKISRKSLQTKMKELGLRDE
ncbi:MAG: DNA-binding response regulator [Sandaracinus sp.]|nr:DNA-binding response regulator [Sandaracinus sp.]|tara:strand:- start:5710 stop:7113 length:1404 start_codon:yes stop_codon:yes gene_type:complete